MILKLIVEDIKISLKHSFIYNQWSKCVGLYFESDNINFDGDSNKQFLLIISPYHVLLLL